MHTPNSPRLINTLTLPRLIDDDNAAREAYAGKLLGDDSYDYLVREDTDCYDAATGDLLFKFRKNVLPPDQVKNAWGALRDAAAVTINRGFAAGTYTDPTEFPDNDPTGRHALEPENENQVRIRVVKTDGTLSKTTYAKPAESGIVGYFNRTSRTPYCRTTAYSLAHPDRFMTAIPLFQSISAEFERLVPERHAAQKAMIEQTSRDFYIPNTVFTTVTVNKNWQTAVHTDKGDLKEGFGVLAAFRAGMPYTGCYFCFPVWRVAIDMDNRDLLFADVHQWHGNTPFHGTEGLYERISLVLYYREDMMYCGTAEQELDRAKRRKEGDKLIRAY